MELGVAHRQAHDAGVADVGAVLAVVDLAIATLVVLNRVAAAAAGVGEEGVGFGVGAGLGRGGRQDGNASESEDLDEGGNGAVAYGHLNLLVVVAGGCDRRDRVAALGVRGRVIDGRCVI